MVLDRCLLVCEDDDRNLDAVLITYKTLEFCENTNQANVRDRFSCTAAVTLDTPVYEVANRLPYLRLHIQLAAPMVIILLDRDRQISFTYSRANHSRGQRLIPSDLSSRKIFSPGFRL
jgi:hypothetical protein